MTSEINKDGDHMTNSVLNRLIALFSVIIIALFFAMPSFAVYPQLPSAPVNGDRVDIDKLVSELVSFDEYGELFKLIVQ